MASTSISKRQSYRRISKFEPKPIPTQKMPKVDVDVSEIDALIKRIDHLLE